MRPPFLLNQLLVITHIRPYPKVTARTNKIVRKTRKSDTEKARQELGKYIEKSEGN